MLNLDWEEGLEWPQGSGPSEFCGKFWRSTASLVSEWGSRNRPGTNRLEGHKTGQAANRAEDTSGMGKAKWGKREYKTHWHPCWPCWLPAAIDAFPKISLGAAS